MYKTKEDVEAMIEIIECTKLSLRRFGMWIVSSLSSPAPGVIYTETKEAADVDYV
jgi:hypothetical protein